MRWHFGRNDLPLVDVNLTLTTRSPMEYDETIELEEYDEAWPEQFEREGVNLLETLADSVHDIAHVGSTAVAGMVAKPVVDIMVGVDSLEAINQHVVALQTIGYEYFGEARVEGRLYFRKRDDEGAHYNVSVVLHQGEHWQNYLAVRDYLREHPSVAEEYGALKRRIFEDEGKTRLIAYSEAKAEFMEQLLEDARQWCGLT